MTVDLYMNIGLTVLHLSVHISRDSGGPRTLEQYVEYDFCLSMYKPMTETWCA